MNLRIVVAGTILLGATLPGQAQNQQVNDDYTILHGTLVRTTGLTEDAEVPFVALELATPLDLSCTSGDDFCQPEQDQTRLHLVISGDELWASFEAGLGGPARVGGTLFHSDNGNHMTPVLLDVLYIEPLPALTLPIADGRYVDDPARCALPDGAFVTDSFSELFVAAGSLSLWEYESACTAVSASDTGDDYAVNWQCWGEGEEFDAAFPLRIQSSDLIVAADVPLSRCQTVAAPALVAEEPEPTTIDLRPPHADTLFYGSRVGMEVTIRAITGQGSEQASIITEHTPRNAYSFCAFYAGTPEAPCIAETLGLPIRSEITANCTTGQFTDLFGSPYGFGGRNPANGITEFAIRDFRTGALLDGSSASGYDTSLALYQALCAPEALERPLLGSADYDAAFDRLRDWRGKSLYLQGGVASLPISRYAMRARPEIGARIWTALGGAALTMSGQYGFVAAGGASVLVDFGRRDILACLLDATVTSRPVSYRLGSIIAASLDGFGVPCPANITEALVEYAPLAEAGQALTLGDWDEDWFDVDWRLIDGHQDLLGLGKVIYHDQCRPELEFNPEWFSVFGSNWVLEARFEADGPICHVPNSRYRAEDDTLELEMVCVGAGFGSGYGQYAVARTPTGGLTFDGTPVSQCASHYFAALDFYGVERDAPASNAGAVVALTPGTIHEWSAGDGLVRYRFADLDVSLAVSSDDALLGATAVTLSGSRAGQPLFTAELAAGGSGFGGIGVFPMGENKSPSLVFASFTGGASCCTEISVVPLDGTTPPVLTVGSFYGDLWDPQDVDGDGRFEFLRDDERFNYLYGPPGVSFRPPAIYTQRDSGIHDDLADARFRPALQPIIAAMSAHCGGPDGWSMAACLGWAATGSKLGTYDSTLRVVEGRMAETAQPMLWDGPADFSALTAAIETQLREFGYLQTAQAERVCAYVIERVALRDGRRQTIGEGALRFTATGAVIPEGSWLTDGSGVKAPFAGYGLDAGSDGRLVGTLPIYYLFAEPGAPLNDPVLVSIDAALPGANRTAPWVAEFALDHAFSGAMILGACD